MEPSQCSDGRNDPHDPIVGIDLGTTNSLIAWCSAAGPRVIPTQQGEQLVPSVVRYEDGRVAAIGSAARATAAQFPLDTVLSSKRLMGRSFAEAQQLGGGFQYRIEAGPRDLATIVAGGSRHFPQEVAADILRQLKAQAQLALGVEVQRAVITVPAYFDDGQRSATRDAAQLAGLDAVRIINEPTAAALAYGLGLHANPQTIAVYDFGGGTFDVTILEVTPEAGSGEGDFFRVLATSGDTALGGDDIDAALQEWIAGEYSQALCAGQHDASQEVAGQALRDIAQAAKIALSQQDEVSVDLPTGAGVHIKIAITRELFESIAMPYVQRTIRACARAMADAGSVPIDRVVMVGGSTRIPLVRKLVGEYFGTEPYTALDPDQVVALGAAVQGAIMRGDRSDMLLLDVIPLSLGIETVGGGVAKILSRNSSIPARASEMFSTSVDNQTGVKLHLLQGEREMVDDCRSLARFELKGIPPMPAGIPQIEVEFLVDANGVLRVNAMEKRSGKRASVQVVPTYGLTAEEACQMDKASVTHAREDMHRHRVIDLAVHCGLDVKWIGDAIERTRSELDHDYLVELEAQISVVRGFIERARIDPMTTIADDFQRAKELLDRLSMKLHETAIAASLRSMPVGNARTK